MAISNLQTKDFKRAELISSKMVEAGKKKDLKLYIKEHYEYHQIYTNATKDKTLIEILENLTHQV